MRLPLDDTYGDTISPILSETTLQSEVSWYLEIIDWGLRTL